MYIPSTTPNDAGGGTLREKVERENYGSKKAFNYTAAHKVKIFDLVKENNRGLNNHNQRDKNEKYFYNFCDFRLINVHTKLLDTAHILPF